MGSNSLKAELEPAPGLEFSPSPPRTLGPQTPYALCAKKLAASYPYDKKCGATSPGEFGRKEIAT